MPRGARYNAFENCEHFMTAASDHPTLEFQDSALSALFDGETDERELDGVLQSLTMDADARETCERYRMISDVLHGQPVSPGATLPHQFLAGVHARLAAEPSVTLASEPAVAQIRPAAANDAVFRWKLVAGLASLAAVVAVGWGVIGGVAPAGGDGVAGPQMALSPAAGGAEPAAVLVSTPQGQVLRDARLEQLLAEHRQYGGMTALQSPAGFLRDATYQPAPQR